MAQRAVLVASWAEGQEVLEVRDEVLLGSYTGAEVLARHRGGV